jgi:poly-gamma-glutamate capsule biosynthesis protein CapA/YwtB (metallophosphatase superfamily)
MRTRQIVRRWIGGLLVAAMLAACASPSPTTGPSQPPTDDQRGRTEPFGSAAPTAATTLTTPTPRSIPTSTPAPASIAYVPVVGFWSSTAGISRGELEAALGGRSRLYRRVLSSVAVPGSTPSTSALIRVAVNADPRTLGLLPADQVTVDVHALSVDGLDLFGNGRLRSLARWPLLVSVAPGTPPSSFDAATTWTIVAGGDVMLDRSIYDRTVRKGKGADYPWDGGSAAITGRHCCSAAGQPLPTVRRTGPKGTVRALFREADLAVVNLEGPALDAFRWHPHGLTFTFDPALLVGLSHVGIDVVTIGNNHIGNAGSKGVVETIRHLDDLGIAHVGAGRDVASARQPAWFDVAGQRVALLGYDAIRPAYSATSERPGSARLTTAAYRADISAVHRDGADVVVVLPHWGTEYTADASSAQQAHAHKLADAGATLVLGSHSHSAGAVEVVDGRPVLYSLGNLVFDITRSEETVEGLIVEITFSGPRPVQIRLHPTVIVDQAQPNLLDPATDGKVVIERMRRASIHLARQ